MSTTSSSPKLTLKLYRTTQSKTLFINLKKIGSPDGPIKSLPTQYEQIGNKVQASYTKNIVWGWMAMSYTFIAPRFYLYEQLALLSDHLVAKQP